MSYADTMSEADEMRAWEEGRLQGLKDAAISMENTPMKSGFARLIRDMKKNVWNSLESQKQFLKEVYWDDEDE